MEDFVVWHYNSDGRYYVKLGYLLAYQIKNRMDYRDSSSLNPSLTRWKVVWNFNSPPKVNHFWWNQCMNAIPSTNNLFSIKCIISFSCSIFNGEIESVEHILFSCLWTRSIWNNENLIGVPLPHLL